MAPVGTHLRRGITAGVGALVLANVLPVAVDGAEAPLDGTSPVAIYTPVEAGMTTGPVHLVLGADPGVVSVQLAYSSDGGSRWQPIGGLLTRRTGSTVFETTWPAPASGSVRLRATGYDVNGVVVGVPAEEGVTLSTSATRFTFTTPGAVAARVGVFKRTDGRWFAAVSGTTTAIVAPAADAPLPPAATLPPPTAPTTSTLAGPTGRFDSTTGAFTAPVDLSAYAGQVPAATFVPVRVNDGTSSDAVDAPIYTQAVTAVRSTTTTLAGTTNVTVTARVTDQYGQPVAGAPVRLAGYSSGATAAVAQLAVTDVLGTVTFTGPGTGTGPVVATGYPTGFYTAYADLNVDGKRSANEPGYESVVGTVSFAAPGKRFYHDNRRTKYAGGVLADSVQGTRAAAAKGYPWIDQDGQLSYSTLAVKRRGAARVTLPTHLTWVNAHGAPYLPRWMKKGDRFENRSWAAIRTKPGLRSAELTFKQNAAYGISTEWEVKDIRPFTTKVALDAAFTDLAAAAQRYYGPTWQTRVEVKMLSNLSGGPSFALKVLKVARAHGFTTIYLARGNATRVQMPASAHRYITFVRGARGGLYAPVPPASQDTPVVVTGPPPVAKR